MSFEPITINSQEELDAMFKERVTRAKESTRKELEDKFSDYEELKAKAESLTTQVNDLTNALNDAKSTGDETAKTIEELNAKVAKYETDSVKTRIANEVGLGYDAISFLQGEDEESIKASAEALVGLVGKNTAPLANPEGGQNGASSEDSAYKGMLNDLFNE